MTPAARAQRREEDVRTVVLPHIARITELKPKTKSALLVVSQFWSDNANDEVHGVIVYSIHDEPQWPHQCIWGRRADEDFCTHCFRREEWFSLPYHEESFRAWESFCREHANQDDELNDAYLPYALFRRDAQHGWEPTLVATPLRAWFELEPPTSPIPDDPTLDPVYAAPESVGVRTVAADALLEHGAPRGEFIVRQLQNARASELLALHEREWLGPLASVVPRGGAVFTNGFLEDVSVYFDEEGDFASVLAAREWLTVRRLRFLPRSQHHLSPKMCRVRQVGPVDEHIVLSLEGTVWSFERMQIRMHDGAAAEVLAELLRGGALPHLRELVVHGEGATPAHLAPLVELGIRTIDVACLEPSGDRDRMSFDPAVARQWLAALGALDVQLAFGSLGARGEPAGPWAHLRLEGGAVLHETSWRARDTRLMHSDSLRAVDALRP